ncbi:glycosyltransferase family 2 protein [Aurantimonas sp. A2-1-M11]|uniref:glycosyltransferase family 2 protein n=1 Tax=Aurantimonas sp. A2-1-M11 TaxID=3113712 RepID=UPI002F92320C
MTEAATVPRLTVVILTMNETKHIGRALRSVAPFADRCIVVDSGSTDDTVAQAQALGAEVFTHPFVNQARQFNWALDRLPADTGWVFRLDADEVVSEALGTEIAKRLPDLPDDVAGLTVPRRISFLGRPIRHGGLFPVHILRLFRLGRGRSEDRWMDEHIAVAGQVVALQSELLDDNLNPLGWWIDKHNRYASREAVELLNLDYGFTPHEKPADLRGGQQASVKRWLKERAYARLPGGLRALAYFLYRYVLRLGFLDGREGAAFHFLQGLWYRYLVDAKLYEVRLHMRRTGVDAVTAIREVLGIDPLR